MITASGEDMATQVRDTATRKPGKPGRAGSSERPSPRVFIREVNLELRKVIWPTRKELITYTTVAFVFVVVMSAIVTGLDTGFTKLIFAIFG
jgi:preprotein translocase subunit SecE